MHGQPNIKINITFTKPFPNKKVISLQGLLVHAGIQNADHSACSLVTILTTLLPSFKKTEVPKFMGDR